MNNQKAVIYKIGLISLSLYSLVVIIYFLFFYKPFEPIPDESYEFIKATNDILKSTHRESIIFFLIFSLIREKDSPGALKSLYANTMKKGFLAGFLMPFLRQSEPHPMMKKSLISWLTELTF